jgi:hypothetical protein
VKTGNWPVLFVILNFMVIYLLVGKTMHLNILFWIQDAIRSCSWKSYTFVYAVYFLLITVTVLFKKDNAMNIRIQPYVYDRRGWKHGIAKRKVIVSVQFWLLVEKIEVRLFLALKAQRKLIVFKWSFFQRGNQRTLQTWPVFLPCGWNALQVLLEAIHYVLNISLLTWYPVHV